MCGRVSIDFDAEMLAEVLGVEKLPVLVMKDTNAPPGSHLHVVREKNGKRVLSRLRWGLIPAWAKDPRIAWKLINARCETLRDKPSFRDSFRYRRCVIPVSGFYEWQKRPEGKKPFFIRRREGKPILLAGLWDVWKGPEGPLETFTIITTAANELVRPLHDRMPVILSAGAVPEWVANTPLSQERLQVLFRPVLPSDLEVEEVSGLGIMPEVVPEYDEQLDNTEDTVEVDVYKDLQPNSPWSKQGWLKDDK